MTNEQFIKCLNILQTAVKNADSEVMSQIVEHAKKLVAVAEAAKKCFPRMIELGLDEEDDFDNLMVLIDSRECE